MIIFYIIFFFLATGYLLQLFNIIGNGLCEKFILTIIALLLITIAGFNITSNDYDAYVQMFQQAAILPFHSYQKIHGEFVFLTISGFIYEIFNSPTYVFLFFSTISIFITFKIIFKDSRLAFFSVIIYLSHAFLNKEMIQIRAGIASAIVLFAISMQARGENKRALVLIIISSLFHTSALVALLPYTLCLLFKNEKHVRIAYILLSLSIIFYLLGGVELLISTLQSLGLLSEKVSTYLGWKEYNYDLGILNPNTIKQLLLLIISIYFFDKSKFYTTYFCYFYSGICWLIGFSSIAIIAARVSSILSVSELILIPTILINTKKNRVFLGILFLTLYTSMFIINIEYKTIIKSLDFGVI
ncbi:MULTISPECIES: EpsG family protein [Proteus]|uniref:EpsG family protein n=1 Tax=Proteus TaxID=583 RepID=UPI000D6E9636|nr:MULTISPECIES: EpsG family protein [Proteus]MBG2837008.1 EpsG family protein [Proteus terrae subsp. cibarius]MBG2868667.1 EpsG family protein [Proteus terrae subsp. cibarius]MBJ2109847.1 EpsG family protein [Proteus terrae]MBJ2133720.1 EpsG family protein [Proteus terrae]